MKTWDKKISIKGTEYTVVEHTDDECTESRNREDGYVFAPVSHGFVCLYKDGEYKMWCGINYAENLIVQ